MTLCTGLDLSLSASGVCAPGGTLSTLKPPNDDRTARLLWIYGELRKLCTGSILVTEAPFVAGPARGDSTLKLGEMYGVARLAFRASLVAWVPPASLKRFATGKGNATKPDMRVALLQRAQLDVRDDNQVDAWWLWAMGMAAYGDPVVDLPKTHLSALGNVTWPGLA